MVVIHLKAQFVSLIVTVLSGAAELCLFGAALGANRYAECNALKSGKQVSVRLHRMRTKFLAVFAMVVFIVLEVFMSFFSDPALSLEPESRPCVSVGRYDRSDGDVFNFSADSVFISCIRAEGDQTFQRIGNRSLVDPDVRCSKTALYKFSGEGREMAPLGENESRACNQTFGCIFAQLVDQKLRISAGIRLGELDSLMEQRIPIPYLVTILLFEIDSSQEAVFAERALNAFISNVNDPLELRRRILTSSEVRTCPFFRSEDATEVPLALIIVIVVSWALSLLAFLITLLFKRHIFYDMGDPLHWAQRTYRHIDEPITGNPVVTSVYEHGERLMYVSSSSSDEYDFLRKVRTSLRHKFRRNIAMDDVSVEEQHV